MSDGTRQHADNSVTGMLVFLLLLFCIAADAIHAAFATTENLPGEEQARCPWRYNEDAGVGGHRIRYVPYPLNEFTLCDATNATIGEIGVHQSKRKSALHPVDFETGENPLFCTFLNYRR